MVRTGPEDRIREHLTFLYGAEQGARLWPLLAARLEAFRRRNPRLQAPSLATDWLDERDVFLVTYGDQIQEPDKPPLQSLDEVLTALAGDFLRGVHILPFYPYSSDDGFSVIDYKAVDPHLGSWEDIHRLGQHFRLMFDAVINHISRHSAWFQGFLHDQPPYTDYFIKVDPSTDLSQVVRPRALPLWSAVETAHGTEYVWTTFSEDQMDLNYANPQVLLEMIEVLLFYVEQGAGLIRLDAIAFLWKEHGTPCIHLPQTHRVVKLFRAVLDAVAPGVLLVTETNVPHTENICYLGDGTDEAQLVYQFPLPPLTWHAFHTADATCLQRWAAGLKTPSPRTTFLNFLASHDGIGLRPVEGILSKEQIAELVALAEAHGGYVSYRANPDGSRSPYELNIVYFDALNDPNADEPQSIQVDRFMASQAILLSLAGVPGIYVHSLFGSRNWREGVAQTGHYRTINRQKFQRFALEAELMDPSSTRYQVFHRYRALIKARSSELAFHPNGDQRVLAVHPALFCLVRTAPDESSRVLCVHNVSPVPQTFHADLADAGFRANTALVDLVSGKQFSTTTCAGLTMTVPGYGVLWLRESRPR
ncbi:MAG: sugar phosphorylase [Chloroflexi bacterium]|nr:sugar phosphorylase [Chloroflexota bacterium]